MQNYKMIRVVPFFNYYKLFIIIFLQSIIFKCEIDAHQFIINVLMPIDSIVLRCDVGEMSKKNDGSSTE